MRRFHAAARNRHQVARNIFKTWRCSPQMVVEGEHRRFFHANTARPQSAIREGLRGELRRTFIFLPYMHFSREAQLLAKPPLFKCSANDNRLALLGNE